MRRSTPKISAARGGGAAGGAPKGCLFFLSAAHRAGLTTVIIPKRNEHDLDDLPDDVRQAMTFVLADQIDNVLQTALPPVEA